MTLRAIIATIASFLAVGNDPVARFEGVHMDGRKGEHCGDAAVPEITDVWQLLFMELFKRKKSLGEEGKATRVEEDSYIVRETMTRPKLQMQRHSTEIGFEVSPMIIL